MTVGWLTVDQDRHRFYIQRTVAGSPRCWDQQKTLEDRGEGRRVTDLRREPLPYVASTHHSLQSQHRIHQLLVSQLRRTPFGHYCPSLRPKLQRQGVIPTTWKPKLRLGGLEEKRERREEKKGDRISQCFCCLQITQGDKYYYTFQIGLRHFQ